jgi:predicted nucleic acid-binding protein
LLEQRGLTREVVYQALVIKARYQISYWDAAIISAAKAPGPDHKNPIDNSWLK